MVKVIQDIYQQSKQPYGSPRIYKTLQTQGQEPSLGKVKRLMRQEGIYSIVTPELLRLSSNPNDRRSNTQDSR
ncbi:MAG: IS3 family transposase [Trueperaceae bacterium]